MSAKSSVRRNASHRRSSGWSRLLLAAIAVVTGIVLVVGMVLAAAVTIDTFDDGSQYVFAGPDSGDTGNGYTAVSGIGGERDVYIYNSTGGGLLDFQIDFGNTNQCKFNQSSNVEGWGEISWDGPDNDATSLATTGLGGQDLTDGGTNDGLQLLVYRCDGGFDLGMYVYTNTNQAYYTLTVASAVNPPGQSFFIAFSDFSGDAGVVFDDAGAVVLRFVPNAADRDLTIDLFEATAQTDWGDLPEATTNYSTTLASDGPRHIKGDLYLGSTVDLEADGFPSASADGDDSNNYTDEDGIERNPDDDPWEPDKTVHITATVNGSGGYLVGWFDWNNDGDLDDSGEMEVSQTVSNGENDLSFTVDNAYTTYQDVYARFRLYDGQPSTPQYSGEVTNGEVEDYKWEFEPTAVTVSSLTIRPVSSQGSFFHWQWLALAGAVGLAFGGGAAAMRKRVLRR
jgi:hypothetical protein